MAGSITMAGRTIHRQDQSLTMAMWTHTTSRSWTNLEMVRVQNPFDPIRQPVSGRSSAQSDQKSLDDVRICIIRYYPLGHGQLHVNLNSTSSVQLKWARRKERRQHGRRQRQPILGTTFSPASNTCLSVLTIFSKRYSEYYDPCQEAADRSMRCLHRNPGNKDLCSDYFQ